ncbi:hypothetical protein JCM3770_003573 [Rhodotorula araucariae]
MSANAHDSPADPSQGADALPPLVELLSLTEDKPAPWYRLPVELKQQVIDEVLDLYEPDYFTMRESLSVVVGHFGKKSLRAHLLEEAKGEQRAELLRLQTINREFHNLVTPLLWRCLELGTAGKKQLGRLERILPRHAAHVRTFSFGSEPNCVWRNEDSLATKDQRTRDIIATRLLRRCRNVEEINIDYPERQPVGTLKLPRLQTARIAPRRHSGREVAFLRQQAQLQSLAVLSYAAPGGVDVTPLGTNIGRFSHLRNLRIDGPGFVCDTFLERAFALDAQLVSLELVSSHTTVSFTALERFLAKYAESLESLELGLFSGNLDEWPVPDGDGLHLPRLNSLAIGTDFSSALFLRLLSPCMRITLFRLDLFPFLDLDLFFVFLTARAGSLDAVFVSTDAVLGDESLGHEYDNLGLDEEEVETILEWCDDLNIAATVGAEFDDDDNSEDYEDYDEDHSEDYDEDHSEDCEYGFDDEVWGGSELGDEVDSEDEDDFGL